MHPAHRLVGRRRVQRHPGEVVAEDAPAGLAGVDAEHHQVVLARAELVEGVPPLLGGGVGQAPGDVRQLLPARRGPVGIEAGAGEQVAVDEQDVDEAARPGRAVGDALELHRLPHRAPEPAAVQPAAGAEVAVEAQHAVPGGVLLHREVLDPRQVGHGGGRHRRVHLLGHPRPAPGDEDVVDEEVGLGPQRLQVARQVLGEGPPGDPPELDPLLRGQARPGGRLAPGGWASGDPAPAQQGGRPGGPRAGHREHAASCHHPPFHVLASWWRLPARPTRAACPGRRALPAPARPVYRPGGAPARYGGPAGQRSAVRTRI